MDSSKLVEVYSTNNANMAEIICNALKGEGIACEISGESQAGLAGLDTLEIGLIVREEDHDRALTFIQDHLENHPEDDTDLDDASDAGDAEIA